MFYTGEVQAKDLYNEIIARITTIQPGESTPWWNKESSTDADGVYTSTGSTGSAYSPLNICESITYE